MNIHMPLWAADSAVFTLKEMLDTSKSIFFYYGWGKKKSQATSQSFEHWLLERKDKVNQNFERIWDCEESLINFSCKGSKKGSHLPSQSAM